MMTGCKVYSVVSARFIANLHATNCLIVKKHKNIKNAKFQ